MQKALIVSSDMGTTELNGLLAKGCKVVNSCPMPSAVAAGSSGTFGKYCIVPTCLVVVEGADEIFEEE